MMVAYAPRQFKPILSVAMIEKSLRVCIIEDDVVFRIFSKTLMREKGFSNDFIEFDNGHKALQWFVLLDDDSDDIPDTILLDIRMPEMDGWAFLDAFKNVKESIKSKVDIYLLSSTIEEADRKRAEEEPMIKGYFAKPFQDEHIDIILENRTDFFDS